MNAREKLQQSLKLFEHSTRNVTDNFQLVKHVMLNRNIDNKLKLHLVRIIPAIVQTNLFSIEDIKSFVEKNSMTKDTEENDKELKGANGRYDAKLCRDKNNNLKLNRCITINKKSGVKDYTIIHELIHAIAQSFKMNYRNGFYEYSNGFSNFVYNQNLDLVSCDGSAFNEGFTELVTWHVLNKLLTNKIKTKIIGIKQNIHGIKHMVQGKISNRKLIEIKESKPFNPYGFQYDELDKKRGDNYTVYKKMAELLNYASDGQAIKFFAKGDLDGFTQEFDSIQGAGEFKNLLANLDAYDNGINYFYNQCSQGKISFEDIYKERGLMQNIKNCSDMIIEYFAKNIEKQINKNMQLPDFIKKLTEFEKMLPKSVDMYMWNESKKGLLHSFTTQKLEHASQRDKRVHFAALNIYYNDCLKDKNNLKKNFELQTIINPQRPEENILIINDGDKARLFAVDLFQDSNSNTYKEILTEDLNSKKTLTQEEHIVKENLDKNFAGQLNEKSKEQPKYLTCDYLKDFAFTHTNDGIRTYRVMRRDGKIDTEERQLGEVQKIGENKDCSKVKSQEQSKLSYLRNVQLLYKDFEERFLKSRAR